MSLWKKLLALSCTFLMMLSCAATVLAEETIGYTMIIWGNSSDRVHLRESPSTDSHSKGLYFTGTEVTVMGHTGDWTRVIIGDEAGYIMSQYLVGEENFSRSESRQPVGEVKCEGKLNLRRSPSYDAEVVYRLPDTAEVVILGETHDHWLYIDRFGLRGYVRSEYVKVTDRISSDLMGHGAVWTELSLDRGETCELSIFAENVLVELSPSPDMTYCCDYDASTTDVTQDYIRGCHELHAKRALGSQSYGEFRIFVSEDEFERIWLTMKDSTGYVSTAEGAGMKITAESSYVYLRDDSEESPVLGINIDSYDSTFEITLMQPTEKTITVMEQIEGSTVNCAPGMAEYISGESSYTNDFSAGAIPQEMLRQLSFGMVSSSSVSFSYADFLRQYADPE